MEAGARDDTWEEFARRWQLLQHYLVSPIDGSALRIVSKGLVDAGGNEFFVLDGVPALIPNLQKLVAGQYEESVAAGPAPEEVLDPRSRPRTITGYVLGRKLTLSSLEPVASAHSSSKPGTINVEDGKLIVTCASGTYHAGSLSYSGWLNDGPVGDAKSLVMFLFVKPPYFLNREAFPSAGMITLYEVLPYFRWYPLDGAQPQDAGFLRKPSSYGTAIPRAPAGSLPSHGPEFVHNVTFFRALFRRYGIDVERHPVLDIGGGDGFLGAAMEAAGADKPISTDIRRPKLTGFATVYPECPKLLLGFADMFSWCYAPDAFSFIAVRNNSAICFATDLNRAPLLRFLADCKRSLRKDGLLYLSVISGESGQADSSGMANRPISEYLAWFEKAGLHVLQLTRLGTEIAFVCCRPEAGEHFEARLAAERSADRKRAFEEYLSGSNKPGVLLNFFLAVNDFAGEIALAVYRKRPTMVGLFGMGALSYYLWRSLYISYYQLHHNVRLIASVSGGARKTLPMRTRIARLLRRERMWSGRVAAAEKPGFLGTSPLRVLVDDSHYSAPSDALQTALLSGRFDHFFFVPGSRPDNATTAPAASGPSEASGIGDWVFPLVSGDHDVALGPSIAEHYVSGRVRGLEPLNAKDAAATAGNAAFETALVHFPLLYGGEQPRA